jgi:hypothetical protein
MRNVVHVPAFLTMDLVNLKDMRWQACLSEIEAHFCVIYA